MFERDNLIQQLIKKIKDISYGNKKVKNIFSDMGMFSSWDDSWRKYNTKDLVNLTSELSNYTSKFVNTYNLNIPKVYKKNDVEKKQALKELSNGEPKKYFDWLETKYYNKQANSGKKQQDLLVKGMEDILNKNSQQAQKQLETIKGMQTDLIEQILENPIKQQLNEIKDKLPDIKGKKKVDSLMEKTKQDHIQAVQELRKQNKLNELQELQYKGQDLKENIKNKSNKISNLENIETEIKSLKDIKDPNKLEEKKVNIKKNLESLGLDVDLDELVDGGFQNLDDILEKIDKNKQQTYQDSFNKNNKLVKEIQKRIKSKQKKAKNKEKEIEKNNIKIDNIEDNIETQKQIMKTTQDEEKIQESKDKIDELNNKKDKILSENSKFESQKQKLTNKVNDLSNIEADVDTNTYQELKNNTNGYNNFIKQKLEELEKEYNQAEGEKRKKIRKKIQKYNQKSDDDFLYEQVKKQSSGSGLKKQPEDKVTIRKGTRNEIKKKRLKKARGLVNKLHNLEKKDQMGSDVDKDKIKHDKQILIDSLEDLGVNQEDVEYLKERNVEGDLQSGINMLSEKINQAGKSVGIDDEPEKLDDIEHQSKITYFLYSVAKGLSSVFNVKWLIPVVLGLILMGRLIGMPFNIQQSLTMLAVYVFNALVRLFMLIVSHVPLLFTALLSGSKNFPIFLSYSMQSGPYYIFIIMLLALNLSFYFIFGASFFSFLLFKQDEDGYTLGQTIFRFLRGKVEFSSVAMGFLDFMKKNFILIFAILMTTGFILTIQSNQASQLYLRYASETTLSEKQDKKDEIENLLRNNSGEVDNFLNIKEFEQNRYNHLTDESIEIVSLDKLNQNLLPAYVGQQNSDVWGNIIKVAILIEKDYKDYLKRNDKKIEKIEDNIGNLNYNYVFKQIKGGDKLKAIMTFDNESSKQLYSILQTISPESLLLANEFVNEKGVSTYEDYMEFRKQTELDIKNNTINDGELTVDELKGNLMSLGIFLDEYDEFNKVLNGNLDFERKKGSYLESYYQDHNYNKLYNAISINTNPLIFQSWAVRIYLNNNISISDEDISGNELESAFLNSQFNINNNDLKDINQNFSGVATTFHWLIVYLLVVFFALDKRIVYFLVFWQEND